MMISRNTIKSVVISIFTIFFLCNNIIAQHIYEKKDTIRIIVSEDIIGNTNRTDVRAVCELWVGEFLSDISKKRTKVVPGIVNSFDEIEYKIIRNKADIIGLFALDYVNSGTKLPIEPVFALKRNSEVGSKYLLVTRNDNNINSLSDLKSKTILTFNDRKKELIEKWLYVEMKKVDVENPKEIISNFIKILEPNKRVFSVFFNKADGCLISKEKFESMCELNPQLKKQLRVLYESPTYLTDIYCIHNHSKSNKVKETINYTSAVNTLLSGNKMLKLFKVSEVVNYEPKYIETLKKLSKDYKHYQGCN